MVSRKEKVRAGAFVVISAILLISVLVSLKYYSSLEESREYFFLYEGSVAGLDKGSKVAFNGVPIGRVREIEFSRENLSQVKVFLDIKVPEDVLPILNDTRVSLKYVSVITGVLYVELMGGQGKAIHNPADPLPVEKTLLDNLEKRLDRLDERLVGILGQIKDLLNEDNRRMVKEFLADTREASKDLKDLTSGAKRIVARTEETLGEIHGAIAENKESLRKSFENAAAATDSFKHLLAEAEKKEAVQTGVETLKKVGSASDALVESSRELSATAKSLGKSAENSLAKVDGLVQDLNQEVAATLEEARKTLKTGEAKIEKVSSDVTEVAESIKTVVTKSQGAVAKAEELLSNANNIVVDSSSDVKTTLESIRRATERMEQLGESLNSLVIARSPTVVRILENLRQTSAELKEFSSKIRQQPSTLLRKSAKDERKFDE